MIIPLSTMILEYKYPYPIKDVISFLEMSGLPVIILGGFVSRLLSDRDLALGDVDCFIDKKHLDDFRNYLCKSLNGYSRSPFNYRSIALGVETYSYDSNGYALTIQSLEYDFETKKNLLELPDFTACQGIIDVQSNMVIATDECIHDNKNMILRPTSTFLSRKKLSDQRLVKYMKMGYWPAKEIRRKAVMARFKHLLFGSHDGYHNFLSKH